VDQGFEQLDCRQLATAETGNCMENETETDWKFGAPMINPDIEWKESIIDHFFVDP